MKISYLIAFVYIVGFFISLFSLHKWGGKLGVDCYDPPHESDYDDYDSNAQAYLSFSFAWILFWGFHLIYFLWKCLMKLSVYIGNKLKVKETEK